MDSTTQYNMKKEDTLQKTMYFRNLKLVQVINFLLFYGPCKTRRLSNFLNEYLGIQFTTTVLIWYIVTNLWKNSNISVGIICCCFVFILSPLHIILYTQLIPNLNFALCYTAMWKRKYALFQFYDCTSGHNNNNNNNNSNKCT